MIYCFGVPCWIVYENGPQLVSQGFTQFCGKFKIQDIASTPYNPAANGLVKALNKTIVKLIQKFIFFKPM